jgi:outer membrane protein assembly factor BamB
MKTNRLLLFLALALVATLLSACGGTPPATTWPGLAADSELAYLTNGAIIYAVNLNDGKQSWSFPTAEDNYKNLLFNSTPVFTSDGQLIVGSAGSNTTLFRLDPTAQNAGRVTWTFSGTKGQWVASPLVVGEVVYAPNADGKLYVFDLSRAGDDKLLEVVELGGRLWSQPTTDGELIFVTSLEHHIFAVDAKELTLAWDVELDGAIPGSALPADGVLYVGSYASKLDAIDISTHKPLWSAPTQSQVWGAPMLSGGTLYFGDLDGNFYALNAADGRPAADAIQPDGAVLSTPIVVDGNIIFVTENGAIYSLEAGGKLVSLETIADSKIYTAPVSSGDLILVAPFQGKSLMVALDKDGRQVWAFVPEK